MSITALRQLWSWSPWLLRQGLWYLYCLGSAILSDPSPPFNGPQLSSVFHCPRFCLQVTDLRGQKGRCSEDLSTSASGCREDKGRSTLDLTSELDLLWAGDWTRWSPYAPSNLGCSCPCVFILKSPNKTIPIPISPHHQKTPNLVWLIWKAFSISFYLLNTLNI